MKLHKLFYGAFIMLTIVSCGKSNNDIPITPTPPVSAATSLNVSYGTDPLQDMDIYLPANRSATTTKVMVIIHGGSWSGGDKTDFASLVDTLQHRFPDFAIFNLNYRLSSGNKNNFPTQENDINSAMQFIYNKSADYLISGKYVLLGESAGAHLAMLQAYKYSVPVKPKAVVSFFGPSDLLDLYNHPTDGDTLIPQALAEVVGDTPLQDSAIYYNSSPVNFISAASAMPTILLHGGKDPLVNPSQSVEVQTRLNAAVIVNQYVFYPNGGHGDWDNATYNDAFNKIQAFVTANVK